MVRKKAESQIEAVEAAHSANFRGEESKKGYGARTVEADRSVVKGRVAFGCPCFGHLLGNLLATVQR